MPYPFNALHLRDIGLAKTSAFIGIDHDFNPLICEFQSMEQFSAVTDALQFIHTAHRVSLVKSNNAVVMRYVQPSDSGSELGTWRIELCDHHDVPSPCVVLVSNLSLNMALQTANLVEALWCMIDETLVEPRATLAQVDKVNILISSAVDSDRDNDYDRLVSEFMLE